jgi:hypothetical protein
MKKFAAMFFALSLMGPGSAFAFGAIAVDDAVGETEPAYGFATGEDTKEAAQKMALKYCKEHGDNCKVVGWFATCGAYASSKKYYGYGYGATKAKATADALKMCGNNKCEIVVSECE